ncbi:LysR family transcriptional regulator [Enterocloster clostridioformis]|uniref:LysR family transcriptional regulator n=1 Tax=Enterocloster clostridioformis TaxID=1531 RepID=UPI00110633F0|nr:LysR family transcriptional regulator [Enterocloster clostridioformis]
MNLEWYYTFLVVAKYQNYRKAADELFITQTTVFNHIKNLEGVLGVNLFEQFGRNIILTESGKYFYPIAQKTINVYEQGLYDMKNMGTTKRTKLNLAVTTYIDGYLLPKFLPILFNTAPQIDIATTVLDQYIPQAIEDNQYDIGIDRREPNTTKVQYKNVCEGRIQLAVPNLPENDSLISEDDFFKKYRVITDNHPTYWDSLKTSINNLYPDANFVSISSVRATEDLISANQGVSYLPVYIVKGSNQSKIRLIAPQKIESPISFTYLIWKKESSAIHTFIKLFEDFIAKEQEKTQ